MSTIDTKSDDTRMNSILGINYRFDARGAVLIEQGYDQGNDGDVACIELHPIFLRLLAEEAGLVGKPSTGLVPDSVVARLCLIADRMDELQEELHKLDVQPYSQPWEMGRVVLNDLDQLLEELGFPAGERRGKPAAAATLPAKQGDGAGTTGSLL